MRLERRMRLSWSLVGALAHWSLDWLAIRYQTLVTSKALGNRSGGGSGKLWTDGHIQST
jgi:hypothetical protein